MIIDVISAIADAVIHFSDAIQWAFSFLSSLFNGILDIYFLAYSIYEKLRPIITLVPSWLSAFIFLYFAICMIIFFVHLGGGS